MDGEAVDCVTDNLNLSSPIERQPFYMMIETSGSNQGYIYLMIFFRSRNFSSQQELKNEIGLAK